MNEFLRIVFKACGMLLEQLIYSSAAALKRNVVVDVDPLKTCNSYVGVAHAGQSILTNGT